jgi:DNA-binding NarL/FixJ family response regulator
VKSRGVLILSEPGLLAQGVRSLLELDPRIEIVGITDDAERAAEIMRERRPAVLLIDADHFRVGLGDLNPAIAIDNVSTMIALSASHNTVQVCHIEQKSMTETADLIAEIAS